MLKKNFLPTLLLLLIIPTFSSLLKPGYFPMHDDMQAMRLLQIDKCIKDGQIPCRWVPDMGYGYGYPQFNYYSPLPYYVMEAFHLLGLGFLDSVKAGFAASVLISALGMFLLGRALWGSWGGFLSTLFYVYAPYRAVNMYVRGAVGEFWALGFLPLIFWSAREVIKGKRKAMVWLAFSLVALFTSHNITSLIFIPVFSAWVAFLYFSLSDSPISNLKKGLKNVFLATFWGFTISSFFLLPAWIEKGFVHIETLLQGYFNYLAHFVGLGQLLFSNYWGYGTSQVGPFDEISLSVGIIHWILPLLVLGLLVFLRKKKESLLVLFFTVLGWVSLFLIHPKSVWIWNNIGLFAYLQFPWRFLTLAGFCFSVAIGALAVLIPNKSRFKLPILFSIVCCLLIFYAGFFRPQGWMNISDEDKFSGDLWQRQQTVSIFDYLPKSAQRPPKSRAPEKPQIVAGEAEVVEGEKGTDWQNWKVRVIGKEATVHLPLYYFPGWKVWVDGEQVLINYDNQLGLISVALSGGEHEIVVKLTNTPIRSIGNFISFAGLIAIPVFLNREKKKK